MKTVQDIFREAIESGDWEDVRRSYTAITGEEAPESPGSVQQESLIDILNKPMPESVLDMEMPDDRSQDMAGSQIHFPSHMTGPRNTDLDLLPEDLAARYGSSPDATTAHENDLLEDDLLAADNLPDAIGEEPLIIDDGPPKGLLLIPDAEAAAPESNDPVDEFRIEHGKTSGGMNEDGEQQCRRESMVIPNKRKNRFHDNGKAFADEKVTKHPNDPKFGIQSIRPRDLLTRDSELGSDTGGQVIVECGLCHNVAKVSSQLASGYNKDPQHNTYRCNSCNTPNGRAKVIRKQREEALNGGAPRRGRQTQ